MSSIDEFQYYCVYFQTGEEPVNNLAQQLSLPDNGQIPIKFVLYNSVENFLLLDEDDEHPIFIIREARNLVAQTTITVNPRANSDELSSMIAEVLTNTVNIPADGHRPIIEQIIGVVESHDFTMQLSFVVNIDRVTVREHVIGGQARPIPATQASIEALEKVRLDELEVTVRDSTCVICMEGFDHEDCSVEVLRLPCSHIYHGDCIVQWLIDDQSLVPHLPISNASCIRN